MASNYLCTGGNILLSFGGGGRERTPENILDIFFWGGVRKKMEIFKFSPIPPLIINERSLCRNSTRCKILYSILSHALKNTANRRPGLPLHILRYATGSILLYVPVITCAQQFTGVHLRTSQKPAPKLFTSCEPLRAFSITSGNFQKISEHFRRFSEDFKKS